MTLAWMATYWLVIGAAAEGDVCHYVGVDQYVCIGCHYVRPTTCGWRHRKQEERTRRRKCLSTPQEAVVDDKPEFDYCVGATLASVRHKYGNYGNYGNYRTRPCNLSSILLMVQPSTTD